MLNEMNNPQTCILCDSASMSITSGQTQEEKVETEEQLC